MFVLVNVMDIGQIYLSLITAIPPNCIYTCCPKGDNTDHGMLMLECAGVIEENIDFNLHIFGFRDVPSKWRRWHGRKRIKSYEKAFLMRDNVLQWLC